MKMKAMLLGVLLSVSPVWAQSPSPESMKKLMEVQKIDRQIDEMIPIAMQKAREEVLASFSEKSQFSNLPAQKKQQIFKIFTEESLDMLKSVFQSPQSRQALLDGYEEYASKVYTQEEVDAMIAFFSSEVGQSILNKRIKISNGMRIMWTQQLKQMVDAEMQTRGPAMKSKIDKILGRKNMKKQDKK